MHKKKILAFITFELCIGLVTLIPLMKIALTCCSDIYATQQSAVHKLILELEKAKFQFQCVYISQYLQHTLPDRNMTAEDIIAGVPKIMRTDYNRVDFGCKLLLNAEQIGTQVVKHKFPAPIDDSKEYLLLINVFLLQNVTEDKTSVVHIYEAADLIPLRYKSEQADNMPSNPGLEDKADTAPNPSNLEE